MCKCSVHRLSLLIMIHSLEHLPQTDAVPIMTHTHEWGDRSLSLTVSQVLQPCHTGDPLFSIALDTTMTTAAVDAAAVCQL